MLEYMNDNVTKVINIMVELSLVRYKFASTFNATLKERIILLQEKPHLMQK